MLSLIICRIMSLQVDEPTCGGLSIIHPSPLIVANRFPYRLLVLKSPLDILSPLFSPPASFTPGYTLLVDAINLTKSHEMNLRTNDTLCVKGLRQAFGARSGEDVLGNVELVYDDDLIVKACQVAYPADPVSKLLDYKDRSIYFMNE